MNRSPTESVGDELIPPPELCDDAGTIIADTPCRRCGYNLRGLTTNGRCPECATPTGISTYGHLLRFSDPAWVEGLASGARYVFAALLLAGLGPLLIVLLSEVIGGLFEMVGYTVVTEILFYLFSIVWLVSLGWTLYRGLWLITQPDPAGNKAESLASVRRLARITILTGATATAFCLWLLLQFPAMWSMLALFILIALVVGLLTLAAGTPAYARQLQQLASRIPNPGLEQKCRQTLRTTVALFSVIILLVILHAAYSAMGWPLSANTTPLATYPSVTPPIKSNTLGSFNPLGFIYSLVNCTMVLLVLVTYIRWLTTHARLASALDQQARHARETWAAHQPEADA